MIKSGTGLKQRPTGDEPIIDPASQDEATAGYTLGIRAMEGIPLEGLDAIGNGITFRCERPIAPERIVELVLCRTILIEAEVVACYRAAAPEGGWLVHARYRNASPELSRLITNELHRIFRNTG